MPVFQDHGFTPASASVVARDLSEKLEAAIVQHSESFSNGNGHCLRPFHQDWEVNDSGLTINQSKVAGDENYIVVTALRTRARERQMHSGVFVRACSFVFTMERKPSESAGRS
jgi:hypothetical protein